MTIASEVPVQTGLQTALDSGLDNLSRSQSVTFTQYAKQVVSDDGYVFWSATGTDLIVKGSLHYGTERDQSEEHTIGVNSIVFTAQQEVTAFNSIGAGILWIASFVVDGGATIKIAFSSRSSFYEQAGLWHYTGFAVFPEMETQLIASPSDLPTGPIVSNSLPIWLAQNSFAPVYPSFLVPENIVPPYVVAHIEPGMTKALQAAPIYIWPSTPVSGFNNLPSLQLVSDHVRLTLYGFTNAQALQFLASIIENSLSGNEWGFVSELPVPRDEKQIQSEIAAIAMRKTLEFDASYCQYTADAIARRMIVSASISYVITQ